MLQIRAFICQVPSLSAYHWQRISYEQAIRGPKIEILLVFLNIFTNTLYLPITIGSLLNLKLAFKAYLNQMLIFKCLKMFAEDSKSIFFLEFQL